MQNYNSLATPAKTQKVLFTILLILIFYGTKVSAQNPVAYSGPVIVLDAGHGGADEGAKGNYCTEKQITLAIARKIQDIISEKLPEANIFFTRQMDTFIPLHARAKFANDIDADLFISIHCNAMPGNHKHIRGTETYVMGMHKAEENLAVATRENSAILLEHGSEEHYTGLDLTSPATFITLNHYQDQNIKQSISLAQSIEDAFSENHPGKSKGVKQAGFLVLHQVSMPAVLVEAGYLSNSEDEKYLCSDLGQLQVATMITKGIIQHLTKSPMHPEIVMVSPTLKGVDQTKPDNYIYKIQLASFSNNPPDDSKWRKNPDYEIIQDGSTYCVVYGSFLSLGEATKEKESLRKQGISGAFVVKFLGDKRVK